MASSSSSSSSSAHKHPHHHLHVPSFHGGATAAPPPTPSTQPNTLSTSDATADILSRLLHRLPPALSLPKRKSSQQKQPPITATVPLISLANNQENSTTKLQESLLSASTQDGFFQLTGHSIPPELASSAELESLSLFDLTREQKELYFPKNWPLGFNGDEDDDDQEEKREMTDSFCMDVAWNAESTELKLCSLKEFTIAMEKLGMKVLELVLSAVGFENRFKDDPTRFCSLMWISEGVNGDKPDVSDGFYPYVVGLQYQLRAQKYSLYADSGWVSVSPNVDSVMVTLGDIAHVWSNGKLKKVGGRPMACSGDGNMSRCISMCLLVTLATNSDIMLSPLLTEEKEEDDSRQDIDDENNENVVKGKKKLDGKQDDGHEEMQKNDHRVFKSFSFDDYAWRVYHERILFKDPLDRYRI